MIPAERRLQNIPHKHLGAAPCLRHFRAFCGHLDAIELPGLAPDKFQERSRAAAQVEQRSGLLVLRSASPVPPAIWRVLTRSRYQFVIRIRVMQVHF